jgi:hypothetical protein
MHSSHCNALAGADVLDGDTGGLVVCVIRVVWRLFPLTCGIRLFSSYPVLPHFGLIWSFVGSNAVGFNLVWVYRSDAMTRIVDGLVPCLVV